jgi:2'-5' RNA ligase
MRLFYAVQLSESIRGIAARRIESFPVPHPPWRWIPPENYHLTLKFLGEVDDELLPSLFEAAARAASAAKPFTIAFGVFGAFPSLSRPRVLFYRVEDGADMLSALALNLESYLEGCGFEPERRPFRAHLTLARIKRPIPPDIRERLREVPPLPSEAYQEVGEFVLMKSILSRQGARYEVVETWAL